VNTECTSGTEKKAARAFAYGRVQGVGFRYWVLHNALELGVTGWVQNCPDYSVEIYAEAESSVLYTFFDIIQNNHPRAYISRFTVHAVPYEGYTSFEIRY